MKCSFKDIVIDSRTGLNPRKNFVLGSGDNAYITIKDIYDGKINISDKTDRVDDAAIQTIKKRSRIAPGDILFVSIGRIGETAIVQEKDDSWDVNESVFIFTINDDIIIPEYFCLLFESEDVRNSLTKNSSGSTFKSIKMGQLERMEFDIPSLNEQKNIVDQINKIKSIRIARIKELEQFDLLIKARFVEMFGSIYDNKYGYNVMTLQDVCEPIKDGTHQTPTYTEDTVNGFKFLSSKDVTSGKVDWDHLKYIPEELHNELYKRISPRKGDILLAKNGTTGVAAIVDRDEVFDIYVSLALLKPLEMVTAEYLCSAVNSLETKHQFDHSLKGIGVPNLHLGEIKKTKIIVPPIELQKQFADFVHQVDKSKVVVQKALDETQILFNSLMQQYFG